MITRAFLFKRLKAQNHVGMFRGGSRHFKNSLNFNRKYFLKEFQQFLGDAYLEYALGNAYLEYALGVEIEKDRQFSNHAESKSPVLSLSLYGKKESEGNELVHSGRTKVFSPAVHAVNLSLRKLKRQKSVAANAMPT